MILLATLLVVVLVQTQDQEDQEAVLQYQVKEENQLMCIIIRQHQRLPIVKQKQIFLIHSSRNAKQQHQRQ